jgi:hypothetical protein
MFYSEGGLLLLLGIIAVVMGYISFAQLLLN